MLLSYFIILVCNKRMKTVTKTRPHHQANVLEQGHIYFFFRPKVEQQTEFMDSLEDVQRLFMILHPASREKYRLIVIARKRLPEVRNGPETMWGFVEKTFTDPKQLQEAFQKTFYETKTRGKRVQPAARPAGEGVYAIVKHDTHTHLAYILELPEKPAEVQDVLNIAKEGSYVFAIKNPLIPSPEGLGLSENQKAQFPPHLQEKFRDYRWMNVDPSQLLDYEHAELAFIGASQNVSKELGVDLETEKETEATAEIFNDLKLAKEAHPLQPLFTGKWA